MPRLKVFRTPIGFHDAYVAAPSRKAALAAWGADADLFARGAAEEVTDPGLMAEPLARPGTVIRRARGTAADHLAAARPPAPRATRHDVPASPPRTDTKAKSPPRPSRAPLNEAEAALEAHRRHTEEEAARLEQERDRIAREIAALRKKSEQEAARLEAAVDKARATYDKALERWRRA
jgi:hypothetical protein